MIWIFQTTPNAFELCTMQIEKVNLNNGLHLEGGWISVIEQFKKSLNKDYLTLDFLNVKKDLFQQLFHKA